MFLLLGAFVCIVHAAHGQSNGGAAPESLFQEGRRLLEAGEYKRACAALSASLEMDRALGTLLNLALCRELEGRTATAWSLFAEAEALAHQRRDFERFEVAQRHRRELEPRIWRIALELKDSPDDIQVQLDGSIIPSPSLGLPLAIDPGSHTVVVSCPGKRVERRTFATDESSPPGSRLITLRVGPLESANPPDPGVLRGPTVTGSAGDLWNPTTDANATNAQTSRSPVKTRATKKRTTQPALGVGLGAAGIVLLGMSSVLVVDAYVRAARADCDENLTCSPEGLEDRKEARSQLIWGWGLAAAGSLSLGGGLALYLSALPPKTKRSSPSFQLTLRSSF